MKPAVARLILTSALFAGWMGYLGFQVLTRPRMTKDLAGRPLVLSRPQILASRIDVVAEVNDTSGEATVTEVLYPGNTTLKPGDKIEVINIGECRPPRLRGDGEKTSDDWTGPGSYLLPLRPLAGKSKYEVVPIPQSPGFPAPTSLEEPPPRIYPASPDALAEYRHIPKPAE